MAYLKWTEERVDQLEQLMIKYDFDSNKVAKELGTNQGVIVSVWIRFGLHKKYPKKRYAAKPHKLPKDDERTATFWRPYPLNNNYYVSNKGDVYTVKHEKILKPMEKETGSLVLNIGRKETMLGKAVYMTWYPNKYIESKNYRIIHIDGNPKNNKITNLKQVSIVEASRHINRKSKKKSRSIVQINKDHTTTIYENLADAERALGITKPTIHSYCIGERSTRHHDIELMYLDDFNEMISWRKRKSNEVQRKRYTRSRVTKRSDANARVD